MDVLTVWILGWLEGARWVIQPPRPGSPFLQITSLGDLRAIYRRSSRPALVRGATFGLPVLIAGGSLLFREQGFLFILGVIFALLGLAVLLRSALDLAQATPRTVAAYETGFAWLENDALQQWRWDQLAKTETRGGRFRLCSKDGREATFAASLKDTAFAETARAMLQGRPDPHRPIYLTRCPHCGELIAADSTRCLFCMERVEP